MEKKHVGVSVKDEIKSGLNKRVSRLFFGIFIISVGCFGTPMDNTEFQKSLPEKIIWGILGKTSELPCDVTPPTPSDNVKMIFWFKDDIGVPCYSLDARRGLSRASHLTISGDLGNRLYFIMDEDTSLARLKIENVSMEDQGLYRCRVDFVNSPTRNFQVNLTLIEQPSIPRVFDAEGREIERNASAGPFLEGEELFLSCQVNGGKPRPSVTWWYGNSLLDNVVDTSSTSYTTVNQLFIAEVTRQLRNAKFECRATSSEAAGYIVTIIPLVVYLKPNKVKIVTPNEMMTIRKSQNVKCETSGSYPPAKLTWLLDGKPITQSIVTEEETEYFTASILTLSVSSGDDGKELVCRADNPGFPGGKLQDTRRIHVAYPPIVKVQIDNSFSPIKEGDEIRMRCMARARPTPYIYRWYHEGHLVHFNSTSGVFPVDDVIMMKHVDRKSSGRYACSATNTEGESYSEPIDLQIRFTPGCKKGHELTRVGVVENQKLQVQCHVDAIPQVDKFFWTYTTTKRDVLRVEKSLTNGNGTSTLNFEPPNGGKWEDILSLSCWASNNVGQQVEPCLFIIIPADVPEKPRDCIFRNLSSFPDQATRVKVVCRPGNDNGSPQTFVLEVKDVTPNQQKHAQPVTTLSDQGDEHDSPPYRRITGERPVFEIHNLKDGREYELSIYGVNAKGRGPSYEIRNIRTVQRDDTNENDALDSKARYGNATNLAPIYVVLTSCAVILMIVIITSVIVLACRKSTTQPELMTVKMRDKQHKSKNEDFEMNSDAGFGEIFHRRSVQYRASMYGPEEIETRISTMVERPDLILSPRGLNNFLEDNNEL